MQFKCITIIDAWPTNGSCVSKRLLCLAKLAKVQHNREIVGLTAEVPLLERHPVLLTVPNSTSLSKTSAMNRYQANGTG